MLKDNRNIWMIFAVCIAFALLMVSVGCDDKARSTQTPGISPDITNLSPTAIITFSEKDVIPYHQLELDGSASSDPDNDTITYSWSQVSGKPMQVQGVTAAKLTFIVPNVETALVFKLIVRDAKGAVSEPAFVEVKVVIGPDEPKFEMKAVFVSAKVGSDAAKRSGSYLQPVASIKRGIEIAGAGNFDKVYVMAAEYKETVSLVSGIDVIGNVTAVADDGTPVFAGANEKQTIIISDTNYAIIAEKMKDAAISGFAIESSSKAAVSRAFLVSNSSGIEITNNNFLTKGDDLCRDIDITGSNDVLVSGNIFSNSGECSDYIAINIEDSRDINITDDDSANSVNIYPDGKEEFIKAVQAIDNDKVVISGSKISGELSIATNFTGITLNDTPNSKIQDNEIEVAGGKAVSGLFLRCDSRTLNVEAEHNLLSLANAASDQFGIEIMCYAEASSFDLKRNYIELSARSNTSNTIHGVDVNLFFRPVTLYLTNNIVVMEAANEDTAEKRAINFERVGKGSNLSVVNNTLIVTGNSGILNILHSDSSSVSFDMTNNIGFLFGSNNSNAIFSMKQACGLGCLDNFTDNLFNPKFYNKDVTLMNYYDAGLKENFDKITGTNIVEDLQPSYFDLTNGTLQPDYRSIVKDKGGKVSLTIDIDGKQRDSDPDVGATEY